MKINMKKILFCLLLTMTLLNVLSAQIPAGYTVPQMPDNAKRLETLRQDWAAVQKSPPQLAVRDCFLFLLDALDANFLQPKEVEWVLKLVQARMITNPNAGRSYGNIFWGWQETGYDIGDGNNIEFCMQYGMPIKILYNNRLSDSARKTLDEIFTLGIKGARNQEVRISYTNIYLMRIWNFIAYGQIYNQPTITEEGRAYFNQWLNHVARYGNREYDSPTYCGVDLESLLLIYAFSKDADIKSKAGDALQLFLTDLSSHYNQRGGFLAGAHSRDYNRVFGRDLLEEKYFNPLLGYENKNTHLFHQICLSALQQLGLSKSQKELMNRNNRFVVQRWDSLAHTFACDYVGRKVSIASSNQAYSPDDKPFAIYLSSERVPAMPNIAFVMEGRDDHYGTWSATGMGDKMKQLMPPNYPSNGGWNKTRHLMPFMQSAQNKGEMVMLVSGEKDHNCIKPYLNSTIILPDAFDEIWIGNKKIKTPVAMGETAFDTTNTFFAKFEDVVIAFRFLWQDAGKDAHASLFNDGFAYTPARESFQLVHNKALRITLKHPANGKASVAMWWKTEEGVKTDAAFSKFRQLVLNAPVMVSEKEGVIDIAVTTPSGKLGVKADIVNKKRLAYYNPVPLPKDFLFNVDGLEIGKPIMTKYITTPKN